MKTPVQELIENLTELLGKVVEEHQTEVNEDTYWRGVKIGLETAIELSESMLEKEKETIVDFTYKYGDETLAKISKIYDINFNTNEK
jgi:hypothetical protein